MNNLYPRSLRPVEIEMLNFILPPDRSGYRTYREMISRMIVLAQGRRGKGNFILGYAGDKADIDSPLMPVFAYGYVESVQNEYSITVREEAGKQIDVEMISNHGELLPDLFEETKRWTYSEWSPGEYSPSTGTPVREIVIGERLKLVVAKEDGRVWLHDSKSGVNHLIPVTNFYNEVVMHKGIRDPKIVLKPSLLFENLDSFSDDDLRVAFVAYNSARHIV